MFLEVALVVFQGRFKVIQKKFKECFKQVMMVFQGCYNDVTMIFMEDPRRLKLVLFEHDGCFRGDSRVFQRS